MSQERCMAVKQLMKQALAIMSSGATGSGRGISLARTYLEDAYLRVEYHMREQGWSQITSPIDNKPAIPLQTGQVVRQSTLKPAANIPQLRTGFMTPNVAAKTDTPERDADDINEDLSLLE